MGINEIGVDCTLLVVSKYTVFNMLLYSITKNFLSRKVKNNRGVKANEI